MLFLVGATLILSHEQSRTQLENLLTNLVPIAADNLFLLFGVIIVSAGIALLMKKRNAKKRDSNKKQGAYGMVLLHEHSTYEQFSHPREVFAALSLLWEKKTAKKVSKLKTKLTQELWDHLNKTSRSFAAVIRILPSPDCSDSVCIFYLLLRALDTIEDEMDLTKFEEFRKGNETCLQTKVRLLCDFHTILEKDHKYPLQEIIDSQIGAGAEKDLLTGLPILIEGFHSVKEGEVIKNITKEMGEGMAEYVIRDMKYGTNDLADYDRYCHIVAGLVGKGLTQIFGNLGYEDPNLIADFDSWNSMGLLLQRTNITRDVCEDAAEGRSWWPQTIWKSSDKYSNLKDLNDLTILNKMVCNALELIPAATKYLDSLKNNAVFGFCAVPQIMAIATLEVCYGNPLVFTGVVKIRPGQAAALVLALRQDTIAGQKKSYKMEAISLLQSIREKACILDDFETIAACDRALAACGWTTRKSKHLILTSNTQIAISYAGFLSCIWIFKTQQKMLYGYFQRLNSITIEDENIGIYIAGLLAGISIFGWASFLIVSKLYK